MDFKQLYTTANGRIGRKSWWIGMGVLFIINVIVAIIFGTEATIGTVINLILLVPSIMVSVKRCHDRGKSGWWCLLFLIPIINIIWAIIDLGILEGDDGPNEFGADPLT